MSASIGQAKDYHTNTLLQIDHGDKRARLEREEPAPPPACPEGFHIPARLSGPRGASGGSHGLFSTPRGHPPALGPGRTWRLLRILAASGRIRDLGRLAAGRLPGDWRGAPNLQHGPCRWARAAAPGRFSKPPQNSQPLPLLASLEMRGGAVGLENNGGKGPPILEGF